MLSLSLSFLSLSHSHSKPVYIHLSVSLSPSTHGVYSVHSATSFPSTRSVWIMPSLLLPLLTALMQQSWSPRVKWVSVPSSTNSPCVREGERVGGQRKVIWINLKRPYLHHFMDKKMYLKQHWQKVSVCVCGFFFQKYSTHLTLDCLHLRQVCQCNTFRIHCL